MADGGKVSLDVVPNFTSFGSLFDSGLRSAVQTAATQGKRISDALGGGIKTGVVLGTAAAAFAISDFVASGVSHFLKLTDQARQLERVTGGSAEQVSTFAGVIRHLGGDVDSVNRPLGLFASNIAAHPDLFQKSGVAIAKFKDGTTDVLGTLENLRKKTLETASADEADATAKALLSRGFQQLLPYLKLTNEQRDEFNKLAKQGGEIVSQKDIDLAFQYKIHLAEVKDEVDNLKTAAGRKAVGLGDEIFQGLDTYSKITGSDVLKSFTSLDPLAFARPAIAEHDAQQALKDSLYAAAQAAKDSADAQAQLATEEDKVSSAAEGLRSAQESQASAHEAVGKAEDGVAQAQRGVTQASENYQHAVEGVQHAEEGVQKAHENTQRAEQGLASAQQSLNDLLAKGAVDAQAVEQAQRGVESANRSLRDSTEQLAQAQQNLNEIQAFEGVDAADELTQAHLQLSQATLQLAQARFRLGTTQSSLSDPYASQTARLGVAQAQEQQRQAQENINKLNQFGTQTSKNLADAQKQVRDATERVGDSLTAQADAQTKLNEAQAGDPDFQKKVADAKQAVADAALSVRDAEQGERDASLAVRDANQQLVDARQGEVDAAKAVQDAHDNVTKAKQAEEDATYKVRDAQYALDAAVKASTTDQATMIGELERDYPELAGIVEQSYDRIAHAATNVVIPDPTGQGLPGAIYDPTTGKLIPNGPMGTPVPRAAGGSVIPGRTYLIGEKGPELFRDGMVYPSGTLPPEVRPVGGDGGSMGDVHVTVNISGADLADSAQRRQIADLMARDMYGAIDRYRRGKGGQR